MIICYNLFSLHVCVEETRRLGRNMIVHLRQFEVVHWWPTASLSGIHLHKTHQHHLNSGRRTRNGETVNSLENCQVLVFRPIHFKRARPTYLSDVDRVAGQITH